jgi:hypothetical protein
LEFHASGFKVIATETKELKKLNLAVLQVRCGKDDTELTVDWTYTFFKEKLMRISIRDCDYL